MNLRLDIIDGVAGLNIRRCSLCSFYSFCSLVLHCFVGCDVLCFVVFCLGLNIQGDRLAGQRLHKDLHTSAKAKDEMERGFFLNVVIGKCASVFELFACKDQSLLIRRNADALL